MNEWKKIKEGSLAAEACYGQIRLGIYPTDLSRTDSWYSISPLSTKLLESKTLKDAKIEAKTQLREILEKAVIAIRKETK